MINTERISAWLNEPHQLQEIAREAIEQLAMDYPYFAPAHYFLLMNKEPDMAALHAVQQLHPVNPVLLHHLMKASTIKPLEAAEDVIIETGFVAEEPKMEEPAIETLFYEKELAGDYFSHQGIEISDDLPDFAAVTVAEETDEEKEKGLMVVMSFAEWLKHISSKNKKAKEEQADQKALKTLWQQQKLAAAIEEENEEIPEQVFEMAVNSIARKEELVSESLANVYAKQGKVEKAIEMYQKLSLLNPEKNTYFAAKIENLQKEI